MTIEETIKEQLKELFTFYNVGNFDPSKTEHREHFQNLVKRLKSFPQASKAIERYYRTSKSNFFDMAYLWACVRKEISKDLPTKEDAWKEVVKAISTHGKHNKPTFHPLTEQAIGDWYNLCQTDKLSIERAAFYKSYQEALEIYLEERCLE